MYYYVAEPLTTRNERRKIEEIKSLLSQLGIAGEFAVASPARSVEECLELAFKKGFTTIVGIGSDALACRIASEVLRTGNDRIALGMIPLQPQSQMWGMLGVTSLNDIGESLRTRLLESFDAVDLGDGRASIVRSSIDLPSPVQFKLAYKRAIFAGAFTNLVIEPTGSVRIWDSTLGKSGLWQRLFGAKTSDNQSVTQLSGKHWQLATETPCELTVGGTAIATTPLSVTFRPKALKVIVNRATITPDKRNGEKE